MAGYPRNNLQQQLAMKSSANGKSAREQAGLAREMSGTGRNSKPAFSYACEGSARVPAGSSRGQPIAIGASSSSSTTSVPAQGAVHSRGAGAPRPGGNVGSNRQGEPIWTATPNTKGKQRARRFEEMQDGDGDVDHQLDDSGFADTNSPVKRIKAGLSSEGRVSTMMELQSRLAKERKSQDDLVQKMLDAASSNDLTKIHRISSAVTAVKREIKVLEGKISALTQHDSGAVAPVAQGNTGVKPLSANGRPVNGIKAPHRAAPIVAPTASSLDDYDQYFDDVEEEIVPVKPSTGKPGTGRTGKTPLQVTTSAQRSLQTNATVKLPITHPPRSNGIVANNKQPPVRTVAADKEELESYKWSVDVRKALRQRFKLQDFRPNQLKAINATLSGKDVFVLMPTGGGKSMCYQLPAVVTTGVTQGVTIVISPLISLIVDQVTALINKGITAVTLNSTMDAENRNFSLTQLRAPEPTARLVYVTPEMIGKSEQFKQVIQDLYRRKRLARFIVDEAHCVSRWGHDLRPDYKDLSWCKRTYPDIPIMALTATANERVKADVKDILGLGKDCVTLSQSFNRSNLYYEIRKKGAQALTDLAAFIQNEHRGECGIIYCLSRRSCEETADRLRDRFGIASSHYHAAMEKSDRQRVQLAWLKGDVKVICATIAFGMGIDKPDVRFVVHYNLPSSLEGYYQETGRAGRDGKSSTCVLYFSYADMRQHERFISDSQVSQEQKRSQREILNKVLTYCLNISDCRRTQVLQYFGEQFSPEQCNYTCDNCFVNKNSIPNKVDVTDKAKEILSLVKRMQTTNVSLGQVVDVYYGSKAKKIVDAGWDRFPEAGRGSDMRKTDVERLFLLLLGEQLLMENEKKNKMGFCNSYLAVSERPESKRKLQSLDRQRLVLSISNSIQRTQKPTSVQARSKVLPLQVNRPVRSGNQYFVEDEEEWDDEAVSENGGGHEQEEDDGITLGSIRPRSIDRSAGQDRTRTSRNHSAGYGDETDGTYIDSDEEASEQSSDEDEDEAAAGRSAMEHEEDDVEVVHGIADESEACDSDIELVPTQAAIERKAPKNKAQTMTSGTAENSEIDAIRTYYTKHIFWTLQEIAQEAAQTQEIEYDTKFDGILQQIAEERCQVEFTDFQKIKGWDEEMYDSFGKAFKTAISKELKIEQKMIATATGHNGLDAASTKKASTRKGATRAKSGVRAMSIPSTSASRRDESSKISKFFSKEEVKTETASKAKATTKRVLKKATSTASAAKLREKYSSNSIGGRSARR